MLQTSKLSFADSSTNSHRIWEKLRTGDSEALAELFRIEYRTLYDYGMKLTREEELTRDCIQDLFMYIWERRENLNVPRSIRAYLLISLRRSLFKAHEQQKRRQDTDRAFHGEQQAPLFSAEELLIFSEITRERQQLLKETFEQIPERMREALYLKTYHALNYKEISEVMDLSPQVARNYVSAALKRLRTLLSHD